MAILKEILSERKSSLYEIISDALLTTNGDQELPRFSPSYPKVWDIMRLAMITIQESEKWLQDAAS